MAEFEDKVAVITGGGGGIGKATARRLVEEGASVVLSSRRQEVLDAARRELDPTGERVELVAGDVGSPREAERLVDDGPRPLRRRGRARQQHRHLPSRAVPRADRGRRSRRR